MRLCAKFLRGIAVFCAPVCIMACSHDGDDSSSVLPFTTHDAAETASVADGGKSPTLVKTVRFEEDEGFSNGTAYQEVLQLQNNIGMDWESLGNISATGAIEGYSLLMRVFDSNSSAMTKVIPHIQGLTRIEFEAKRNYVNWVSKSYKAAAISTLVVTCIPDDGESVCKKFQLSDDVELYSFNFPAAENATITFTVSASGIIDGEFKFKKTDAIIDNISFYALR